MKTESNRTRLVPSGAIELDHVTHNSPFWQSILLGPHKHVACSAISLDVESVTTVNMSSSPIFCVGKHDILAPHFGLDALTSSSLPPRKEMDRAGELEGWWRTSPSRLMADYIRPSKRGEKSTVISLENQFI